MARAFVFPGQGSQAVGMGRKLAETFPVARDIFQEVDEALKQSLSRLMFDGPETDLVLTENAQPALMAVSLAVTRVLEREGGFRLAERCVLAAGHSLGEYSALAALGTLSVADTARLLKIRGQAMQKAVPVGQGAMVALVGADLEQARAIAAEASAFGVCGAANDNAPGQVVISGGKEAIEHAIGIAAEKGIKRVIMLSVSAPFHCSLMQPAADIMAEALAGVSMRTPAVPIVSNVDATSVEDPETIRALLVRQITGTVRWRESVLNMKEQGVDTLVELGSGKVLSGMARRIDKTLTGVSVQDPDDIEAFLKTL